MLVVDKYILNPKLVLNAKLIASKAKVSSLDKLVQIISEEFEKFGMKAITTASTENFIMYDKRGICMNINVIPIIPATIDTPTIQRCISTVAKEYLDIYRIIFITSVIKDCEVWDYLQGYKQIEDQEEINIQKEGG